MPTVRQYLRVRKVTGSDLFLRGQVDFSDREVLKPGDVVCACKNCRRIAKRKSWLEHESSCPFCACRESLPFRDRKDLERGSCPQVVYASRVFPEGRGTIALVCILLVLLVVVLSSVNRKDPAGFFLKDGGMVGYTDSRGREVLEGDYLIEGKQYHFEEGHLAGSYAVEIRDRRYLTGEDGRVHEGWCVYEGSLVYVGEDGVSSNRVPSQKGAGFCELEGLGEMYLTDGGKPGQGWTVYDGRLYHFRDGKGAQAENVPGTFDRRGGYLPDAAGFVRTQKGEYYLSEDGKVVTGFVPHEGYLYFMDPDSGLKKVLTAGEMEGFSTGPSGALVPEKDALVPCSSGSVLLEGGTGRVLTGWNVIDGHVYCSDGQGWIRCGERVPEEEGSLDARGRFVPDKAGKHVFPDLICFLDKDGGLMTGPLLWEGKLLLFDGQGRLMANAEVGTEGVTDPTGVLRPYTPGMVRVGEDVYCLDSEGHVLTGWQSMGKLYYFDPGTGKRAAHGAVIGGTVYALDAEGAFVPKVAGMYELGDTAYYVNTDGSLSRGWQDVEGRMMFFGEKDGALQKRDQAPGKGWLIQGGKRFYILEDGSAAAGWQYLDGAMYYFDPGTRAALTGTCQVEGKSCVFREDGALSLEKPLAVMIRGVLTRIGEEGKPEGGAICENGHLYFFGKDGTVLNGAPEGTEGYISTLGSYMIPLKEGVVRYEGRAWYLTGTGEVMTGAFIRGRHLYWADPGTGQLAEDGRREGFPGTFRDGWLQPDEDGLLEVGGKEYLFREGYVCEGWVLREDGIGYMRAGEGWITDQEAEIEGEKCTFDDQGLYVPEDPEIMEVDGKHYYLNAAGRFPGKAGIYPVQNCLAYADADGSCPDALPQQLDGARQVRVQEGILVPVTPGIIFLDGERYDLAPDGTFATGLHVIGRKLYCFRTEDGRMVRGEDLFNDQGTYVPEATGVGKVQTAYYYFEDLNGTVGMGLITDKDDQLFYADQEGRLQSGLQEIGGKRYYFKKEDMNFIAEKNRFLHAIWDEDAEYDFLATEDGSLARGWVQRDGVLHYFDERCHMVYDTVVDGRYINIYGEVR